MPDKDPADTFDQTYQRLAAALKASGSLICACSMFVHKGGEEWPHIQAAMPIVRAACAPEFERDVLSPVRPALAQARRELGGPPMKYADFRDDCAHAVALQIVRKVGAQFDTFVQAAEVHTDDALVSQALHLAAATLPDEVWDDTGIAQLTSEMARESGLAGENARRFRREPAVENEGVDDLVTLDEAAAIVHKSKKTLEKHLKQMPPPHIQGGGGKSSLWKWSDLRPWLEKEFVPDLPARFRRNVR